MERQMAGGPDGPPALAFVWLEKLCSYLVENVRTSIVPYKSFAAFITIGKVFHSAHTPAGVPLNHIPCNDELQI